jgi:hypothetical protein
MTTTSCWLLSFEKRTDIEPRKVSILSDKNRPPRPRLNGKPGQLLDHLDGLLAPIASPRRHRTAAPPPSASCLGRSAASPLVLGDAAWTIRSGALELRLRLEHSCVERRCTRGVTGRLAKAPP